MRIAAIPIIRIPVAVKTIIIVLWGLLHNMIKGTIG